MTAEELAQKTLDKKGVKVSQYTFSLLLITCQRAIRDHDTILEAEDAADIYLQFILNNPKISI